ncbi:MAG: thermonuclease family protein [Thermoanaerobaculia bacterium]
MRLRLLLVLVPILASPAAPAAADWIVFLGGGIQEISGSWEVKGNQVRFHSPSGTLLSVRADDVDLPASAFLSWQVGERRHLPAAAPCSRLPSAAATEETPCVPARIVRVLGPETLELAIDGNAETVHLDCLDAPDTRHRFPQLAWYGMQTAGTVGTLVRAGQSVCWSEAKPSPRDAQGHRIVFVRLENGRDLGAELIGRGLALAGRYACLRGPSYQALEDQARGRERGHWGPSGNDVSVAIVAQSASLAGGPPARTAARRG